jgi:hypothetical protein
MKIGVLELTKHWNSNTSGETIGVTEDTAKAIIAGNGANRVGDYDNATHTALVVKNADDEFELKVTAITKSAPK